MNSLSKLPEIVSINNNTSCPANLSSDFLDDEPVRKPKGKKIKKMRYNFDK